MHVYRRGRYYWVKFTLPGGLRPVQRSLRVTDAVSAHKVAADVVREAERRASGLAADDPITVRTPLAEVLEAFGRDQLRRGCTERHARETRAAVLRLAALAGAPSLVAFTPPAISVALERLGARSPRRQNYYRWALHALFRWLQAQGRVVANPVLAVARAREVPTYRRRALTDDELVRLLAATPPTRRLLYWFAASTGLRRGELFALAVGDAALGTDPAVTVTAQKAKSRRERVVPLPEDLAAALRDAWGGLAPADRPFARAVDERTWDRDLADAGVARETEEGRVTFHALRVTYCTRLGRAGVPLQVAMRLMGHSDPKLTAAVYTRLQLHDLRAAAAALDLRRLGDRTAGEPTVARGVAAIDEPNRTKPESPSITSKSRRGRHAAS